MEFKKEKRSVMTEEAAYTMLYMLRGATEEYGGTARGLWDIDILKYLIMTIK